MSSFFPRVLSRLVKEGEARWIRLISLTYLDAAGATRSWDAVHRTTTPMADLRTNAEEVIKRTPDAVAILAMLHSKIEDPSIVLVRQFRPPLDAHTIELPAGLVDAGESPQCAALRELREETGYIGVARSASPPLALSPGLASETVSVVYIDVDMSLPANANPVAEPDEGEYVERIVVPVRGLGKELDRREQAGDVVFAAVRTLALGMELGQGRL